MPNKPKKSKPKGSEQPRNEGLSSSVLLSVADEFSRIAEEYDARYMAREKVSIWMMSEREDYLDKCKWAARELRSRASNHTDNVKVHTPLPARATVETGVKP